MTPSCRPGWLGSDGSPTVAQRPSALMDPLADVTPLILTFNEEANIGRTLAGLGWARRIVVIDSGSTDATLQLLAADPRVQVFQRSFDTHARQWNYGLAQVSSTWVLSLDADYLISEGLAEAMRRAFTAHGHQGLAGYSIPFRYCVFGRPLRGTVLPPRIALFRRDAGAYVDDGHTQDLQLQGRCAVIGTPILHDDRKPLRRWLWAQERYLSLERDKLLSTPIRSLSRADRLRRGKLLAPLAMLLVCLIQKRCLLDGWRGWFYALQRTYVEVLLALMLLEVDCTAAADVSDPPASCAS